MEVKLQELGEGIESGDVLQVLVKEGDQIEKDQGIIELETDKATVEVPSTHAGRIAKVHVSAGDTVPVGATLITLESADQPKGDEKKPAPKEKAEKPKAKEAKSEEKTENAGKAEKAEKKGASKKKEAPKKEKVEQQAAREEEPEEESATADEESKSAPAARHESQRPAAPKGSPPAKSSVAKPAGAQRSADGDRDGGESVAASPAVRRFAREVGVDLSHVSGSGPGGRISRDDVLEAVRQSNQGARRAAGGGTTAATAATSSPSLTPSTTPPGEAAEDAWGPVRLDRMSKIRRTIAAKMHESWTNIPRVTNVDDADVTELEKFRQSSKADYAERGIKLTSLPFVIKAVAMSLKAHPTLNASLDSDREQIVYKEYVNIGIAVDTERGLIVPSLRNADRLSIPEVAHSLAEISENVRQNKYSIDDLRGSTFTISNMGAIGGTYSTPIINPPEVAILLVGRSRKLPVVVGDQVAIRLMMPLSLSYDHRLVDGAAAARFLNEVISYLKAPSRLLLAP